MGDLPRPASEGPWRCRVEPYEVHVYAVPPSMMNGDWICETNMDPLDSAAIAALPDWIAAADAARAEAARLREVIEAARPVLEWYAAQEAHSYISRGRRATEALAALDRIEGKR